MAENKVAFISCVNNEDEYAECKKYIERLAVPNGYDVEIIPIRNAKSMAAGYNRAMELSNAKYKIYLHQDVFIINTDFIRDIIECFEQNKNIGLLGCIGTTELDENAMALSDWNIGVLLSNDVRRLWSLWDYEVWGDKTARADALDGLLIATQYDVKWRDDLFDGWDFYDISQCMEFHRTGYQTVVPYQNNPWCYHDNTPCKMKNYDLYRARFCKEYTDMKPFCMEKMDYDVQGYEDSLLRLREIICNMIDKGQKEEVQSAFEQFYGRSYIELTDLEVIGTIDRLERQANVTCMFWRPDENSKELLHKLMLLRHLVKRLEYDVDTVEQNMKMICQKYSVIAVAIVCSAYTVYIDHISEKIITYYEQNGMNEECKLWNYLKRQF